VSPLPTPRALLCQNSYATPMSLASHIIHHSPVLSELIITREWLQDTAPPPQIKTAATYWNFTKLSLMHARRSGVASTQANLVKELDPDVVNTESGAVLVAEDAVSDCGCHRNILSPDDGGIRRTRRRWLIRCTRISVLVKASRRWSFVAPPVDLGGLQLYKAISCSTGQLMSRASIYQGRVWGGA
jgi:hypothetical protein